MVEPGRVKKSELKAIIAKGEDSRHQFKKDVRNVDALASEMVAFIRNPIPVSYVAKGLLPYRGLGSGIKRALEAWPEIDFVDDQDGCLFTATVHRKAVKRSAIDSLDVNGSPKSSSISSPKVRLKQKIASSI